MTLKNDIERDVLERGRQARKRYTASQFLSFMRGIKRDYDSRALRRAFARMGRAAHDELGGRQ